MAMGTYCDNHDDETVERKAFDLALADGNEDPERMTYKNDGGVPYPYGPIWSRYIDDAVAALGALSATQQKLEIVMQQQARDDLGGMLVEITGWQLGCPNAARMSREIIGAINSGLVGFRIHYAKAFPSGVEFYEISDKGLQYVREHCGDEAALWAADSRDFYRRNAAKPQS